MSFEDTIDTDFSDFCETFQCPKCHCTLAILVPDSEPLYECHQSAESAMQVSSPPPELRPASSAAAKPQSFVAPRRV